MATFYEAQVAVKMNADCPRSPGHEVGEESDDASALEREAWAEEMVRRGAADRRTALRCADAVWELQRARDRECAGVVEWAGPLPGDAASRWLQALSQVWAWPDARKGLWALLFVMGRPPDGCETMRKCAVLRGCSPEDVNNVVDALREILGAPRNRMQKSERALATYKRTNGAI